MCCESSVRLLQKQQHLRLYWRPQGALSRALPSTSIFTGPYIFSHTAFKSQNIPIKSDNSRESCGKEERLSSGNVWLCNDEEEGRPGQRSAWPLTPLGCGACRWPWGRWWTCGQCIRWPLDWGRTCLLSVGRWPVDLWPAGIDWLNNLIQTCNSRKNQNIHLSSLKTHSFSI